ncbi:hypothetical protein BX666DRAFT_1882600 [Dichotomocladium elegans]|nr:hypothetical protein BX666DRAFT_1882600 [Dichotomocladium elegans]
MNPTDYSFSSQEAGDQTPDQRNQPQNPYAFELHMPPQPLAQFGVGGSPAFSSHSAPGDMATGGRGPGEPRGGGPPTGSVIATTGRSICGTARTASTVGSSAGRRLEDVHTAT